MREKKGWVCQFCHRPSDDIHHHPLEVPAVLLTEPGILEAVGAASRLMGVAVIAAKAGYDRHSFVNLAIRTWDQLDAERKSARQHNKTSAEALGPYDLRQVAVEARSQVRTVKKLIAGGRVRHDIAERIRVVLRRFRLEARR